MHCMGRVTLVYINTPYIYKRNPKFSWGLELPQGPHWGCLCPHFQAFDPPFCYFSVKDKKMSTHFKHHGWAQNACDLNKTPVKSTFI